MSLLDKITDIATGGLGKQVFDLVKTYFPPDMTPEAKANMQVALEQLAIQREREVNQARTEAERAINERIAAHEGTASDLKSLPILGSIMLFLRGSQRPIWGFATLWFDYQWYTVWTSLTPEQEASLYVINILVLGFLFGERAIINVMPIVMPIISRMLGKK